MPRRRRLLGCRRRWRRWGRGVERRSSLLRIRRCIGDQRASRLRLLNAEPAVDVDAGVAAKAGLRAPLVRDHALAGIVELEQRRFDEAPLLRVLLRGVRLLQVLLRGRILVVADVLEHQLLRDRKSTRLNSSHGYISYAVFCLKKKKKKENE